jgi:hypothetical protein
MTYRVSIGLPADSACWLLLISKVARHVIKGELPPLAFPQATSTTTSHDLDLCRFPPQRPRYKSSKSFPWSRIFRLLLCCFFTQVFTRLSGRWCALQGAACLARFGPRRAFRFCLLWYEDEVAWTCSAFLKCIFVWIWWLCCRTSALRIRRV